MVIDSSRASAGDESQASPGHVARLLARLVLATGGTGLLIAAGVGLIAPRNSWFVFDRAVVTLGCLALLAASMVLAWCRGGGENGRRRWCEQRAGITVLLGTIVGTLIAALGATGSAIEFGWDAGEVHGAALTLHGGGQLSEHTIDYFARFPNNVALLWLELSEMGLAGAVGMPPADAPVIGQVAMCGVVLGCLGQTARVLGRPERILPVQAVAVVLLAISPHVAVPYSDLPAAACVSLAVLAMASYTKAASTRARLAWGFLAAASIGAGLTFKPFVVVLLIAIGCVGGLVALSRATRRDGAGVGRLAATALAATLLATGVAQGIGVVAGHGTGLTSQRLAEVREPFPVELWLAAGTFDTQDPSPTRRYGAYNQELVDLAVSIDDQQERREVLRDRAVDQVRERGLWGNLSFFSAKAAWVWGDGTFWAMGEGLDSRQPALRTSQPWASVATWNVATGEHYWLRAALVQAGWLALLAWLGVALLRRKVTTPDPLLVTWCLSLIGLTGYLMVFEARPRYVVAFLPVLLALAASLPSPRVRCRAARPER